MSQLLALACLLPLLPGGAPALDGESDPSVMLILAGEAPEAGLAGLRELGFDPIGLDAPVGLDATVGWGSLARVPANYSPFPVYPTLEVMVPPGGIHAYLPSAGKVPTGLDVTLGEWRRAVGAGSVLHLLGRSRAAGLEDADRVHLRGFARAVSLTYGTDVLARAVARGGVSHSASSILEASDGASDVLNVLDGDGGTWWSPTGEAPHWLEFQFAEPVRFDRIVLGEGYTDLPRGRVTQYRVLARETSGVDWTVVHAGSGGIGSLGVIACDGDVVARQVRIAIDKAVKTPALSRFELYLSPPRVTLDEGRGTSLSPIRVRPRTRPGATVRYTLDGSEVTADAPLAEGAIVVDRTARLRARAFDARGASPFEATGSYRIIAEGDWLEPAPPEWPPEGPREGPPERSTVPGLHVEVFEGKWTSLEQLADASPVTGQRPAAGFDVTHASRKTHVALRYRGYLAVPEDGLYTLALASDDGSRLSLHGEIVVDNGGMHGLRRREAKVALRSGLHPLEVLWFNGQGPGALEVRWSGPGVARDELLAGENLRR